MKTNSVWLLEFEELKFEELGGPYPVTIDSM
jgi:hypothetical protein